jgi:hypothetical protein
MTPSNVGQASRGCQRSSKNPPPESCPSIRRENQIEGPILDGQTRQRPGQVPSFAAPALKVRGKRLEGGALVGIEAVDVPIDEDAWIPADLLATGVDVGLALRHDLVGIPGVHRVATGRIDAAGQCFGHEASRPAGDVEDSRPAQGLEVEGEHLEILGERAAEEGHSLQPETFATRWHVLTYRVSQVFLPRQTPARHAVPVGKSGPSSRW